MDRAGIINTLDMLASFKKMKAFIPAPKNSISPLAHKSGEKQNNEAERERRPTLTWGFILKNKVPLALFAASFILIATSWWWAYRALHLITQPLIIHFNSREGINQIGSIGDLTGMAVLSVVILIVNLYIFLELGKRDQFWAVLLACSTLLYSALIFRGFAAIIGVN
jgi:hypothetical protein